MTYLMKKIVILSILIFSMAAVIVTISTNIQKKTDQIVKELENITNSKFNYSFIYKGKITMSAIPWSGISINNIVVDSKNKQSTPSTIATLDLRLNPLQLLFGKITISAIRVSQLKASKDDILKQLKHTLDLESKGEIKLSKNLYLEVVNSEIFDDYQEKRTSIVKKINIKVKSFNMSKPFHVNLSFLYSSPKGLVKVQNSALISFSEHNIYIQNNRFNGEVSYEKTNLKLILNSNISYAKRSGKIVINNLTGFLNNTQLLGWLAIYPDKGSIDGKINIMPFNVNNFLYSLGVNSNYDASIDTKEANATIKFNEKRVHAKIITDNNKIIFKSNVPQNNRDWIIFDLHMKKRLTKNLSQKTVFFYKDFLTRGGPIKGKVHIDNFITAGITAKNGYFEILSDKNNLLLFGYANSLYNGEAKIKIKSSNNLVQLDAKIDNLQVEPLLSYIKPKHNFISGTASIIASIKSKGKNIKELLDNSHGTIKTKIKNGYLNNAVNPIKIMIDKSYGFLFSKDDKYSQFNYITAKCNLNSSLLNCGHVDIDIPDNKIVAWIYWDIINDIIRGKSRLLEQANKDYIPLAISYSGNKMNINRKIDLSRINDRSHILKDTIL